MRKIFACLFLIYFFGCKADLPSENKIVLNKNKRITSSYGNRYVLAKSGLNYRDESLNKILGKFEYGKKVEVIKSSDNFTSVLDDGYLIKGEWLGVKMDNDTVYAFGGFLSKKLNDKIIKSKRRLRYLYFSNGGLIGYFSDGAVIGCARCDLMIENLEAIFKTESGDRTYTVNEQGEIIENWGSQESYSTPVLPSNDGDGMPEWAIINYEEVL